MAKKVIWLFHHYADPPDGHWTNHYDLFEEVVRNGHRVTIFSSGFSHYSRQDNRLKQGEKFHVRRYNGVRFIFIKTTPYFENNWRRYCNFLTYAVRAYRIGLRDKEKPDVIIGSSPHPFCAFAGYLVAKKKSVPFFFEVHDLWPQFFVELGEYSKRHPVIKGLRWMEKFLYHKADKILPLWPKMDLYFQQFDIPKEKIVWMPMGLKLEIAEDLEPLPGVKGGSFTVMYLGRFGLNQDIMVILDAAKIIQDKGLNDIEFEFVGGGPEREDVVKKARELRLKNLRFSDFLPKRQMFQHMKNSDVLLGSLPDLPHFGKYGQISTKLLEYFLAGRPIIFVANAKDHLVNRTGAGVIVPPNDPKALAEAILRIAAMIPEERMQMGKDGAKYVRKNHDVRVLAKKLESLI